METFESKFDDGVYGSGCQDHETEVQMFTEFVLRPSQVEDEVSQSINFPENVFTCQTTGPAKMPLFECIISVYKQCINWPMDILSLKGGAGLF